MKKLNKRLGHSQFEVVWPTFKNVFSLIKHKTMMILIAPIHPYYSSSERWLSLSQSNTPSFLYPLASMTSRNIPRSSS